MRAGILAVMLLLLTGCTTREGELAGEVFVVTKGGQNVKLGLVTVVAIPEEAMMKFVEQKKAVAASRKQERDTAVQEAEKAVNDAEMAATTAKHTKDRAFAAVPKVMNMFESPAYRRYEALRDEATRLNKELLERRAALTQSMVDRDALESSQFYISDLPVGVASAKSNADGLFSMTLPRTGRFALAARASRQVMDETENFYWLIWVSLDGAPKAQIMLSNDNLTTVESPESVVTLPR